MLKLMTFYAQKIITVMFYHSVIAGLGFLSYVIFISGLNFIHVYEVNHFKMQTSQYFDISNVLANIA